MKTMKITRWIYNEKAVDFENGIAPVSESKGIVEIEVIKIVRETEKAVCVRTSDYEMNLIDVWIPRTQIKESNFGVKTIEAEKKEYTEIARFDSAVEASKMVCELKAEGKKAFVKYVKNDCIVMVAA